MSPVNCGDDWSHMTALLLCWSISETLQSLSSTISHWLLPSGWGYRKNLWCREPKPTCCLSPMHPFLQLPVSIPGTFGLQCFLWLPSRPWPGQRRHSGDRKTGFVTCLLHPILSRGWWQKSHWLHRGHPFERSRLKAQNRGTSTEDFCSHMDTRASIRGH